MKSRIVVNIVCEKKRTSKVKNDKIPGAINGCKPKPSHGFEGLMRPINYRTHSPEKTQNKHEANIRSG